MLSDSLVKLIADSETVTTKLAASPSSAVEDVVRQLHPQEHGVTRLLHKLTLHKKVKINNGEPTKEELDQVATLGNFPSRPSDLFLKIYLEVLRTLEKDPLAGLVSPSLIASSGVVPLSIISPIPTIIGHYADCIVRAEREIFFATNFWESSDSASTIVRAFKELSRRVGERGSPKVVVKLVYDRGTPKQVVKTHQLVGPDEYSGERVQLPRPEEIPNVQLEVLNYHVPPVGTFHSKYCIIDRKIALLNSNNIQDRVNVEMMTHIEGPIVEAFYDMALLSWNEQMNPPLPLLADPPVPRKTYDFGNDHSRIKEKDIEGERASARSLLGEHHQYADSTSEAPKGSTSFDADNEAEVARVHESVTTEEGINKYLNTGTPADATEPASSSVADFRPHVLHSPHEPVPMALVNRRPHGRPGHDDTNAPQNAAWLAAFAHAQSSVFIQTPTFNAPLVVDAALASVKRGVEVTIFADLGFNDEGELLPFQGGTNEMVATDMYKRLGSDEKAKNLLRWYWYTGKDQSKPLNAIKKERNCHVKLMIVDGSVGIQGNGNQDVQSWYHSQEINVLIDSELICREWAEAIRSNQNTHLHGELQKDGIWRDGDGQPLPGATGGPKGPFKSLIGVKGAIQRVRGEGGF
ncbi:hypothetical protein BCR35DRAFT_287370 [Leucosporidium creatinivorum]|uniref:PLD phosphodiesterase domain-containing protein n=1 Tax=Leucosporidium creatinivorum TaxID=106004 RepID=A0A1Y2G0G9_9BASI|nr:hypothetical protein BCR35DRAFT_287370 [Leucosporidium creatinivorum]